MGMMNLQGEIGLIESHIIAVQGIIKTLQNVLGELEKVRDQLDADLSKVIQAKINEGLRQGTCPFCDDPVTLTLGRVNGEQVCGGCQSEGL